MRRFLGQPRYHSFVPAQVSPSFLSNLLKLPPARNHAVRDACRRASLFSRSLRLRGEGEASHARADDAGDRHRYEHGSNTAGVPASASDARIVDRARCTLIVSSGAAPVNGPSLLSSAIRIWRDGGVSHFCVRDGVRVVEASDRRRDVDQPEVYAVRTSARGARHFRRVRTGAHVEPAGRACEADPGSVFRGVPGSFPSSTSSPCKT